MNTSSLPKGCKEEDLLRLVDMCPFLASEKLQYNDKAVLHILQQNPQAACTRHTFRCGIGSNIHPLAVVMALGGSLEVVVLMVEACPEALEERLSGRRTVLHYAISSGVDVEIIQYLTTMHSSSLPERDSFQAIPLHLASSYPSSTPSVLRHLLYLHPLGARTVDHRCQTPLHRACKSRASLEKVLPLIEAYPEALCVKDWGGNTPLAWAERMDHSLSDTCPEVVEVLGMVEYILKFGSLASNNEREELDDDDDYHEENTRTNDRNPRQCRARRILTHFRSLQWRGGIAMIFSRNANLLALLDLPLEVFPLFLSCIGECDNCSDGEKTKLNATSSSTILMKDNYEYRMRMEGMFSIIVQRPDIVCCLHRSTSLGR